MDTKYEFVKIINTAQLIDEISTAGLSSPHVINTEDQSVQIFYENPLLDDNATTLSSVVAAHTANPNYVTLSVQASINTLTAYLTNPSPAVVSAAKAAVIANLASRLPPDLIIIINAQIHAATGI